MEKKNPSLEGLDCATSAFDDADILPAKPCKIKSLNTSGPLLTKQLATSLNGLLNQLDPFSPHREVHQIIGYALYLLNELERLDSTGGVQ